MTPVDAPRANAAPQSLEVDFIPPTGERSLMSSAVGLMQGIRSNDVSIAGTLRGQQTIPLHTFLIRGASEHEAEGASEHGPGGASDHEAAAEDNSQHKASYHAPQAEFRRGSGVLMRRCPLVCERRYPAPPRVESACWENQINAMDRGWPRWDAQWRVLCMACGRTMLQASARDWGA